MYTVTSKEGFNSTTVFQDGENLTEAVTRIHDVTSDHQGTMTSLHVTTALGLPTLSDDTHSHGKEVIGDLEPFVWNIPHYENLFVYGFGVIVTFGTIGNVLSFVVMQTNKIRRQPTSPYLSTLAVADTICLWSINQEEWFHKVFGKPIVKIPCNFRTWVMVSSFVWSSWCVVFVTVERYIAIRYPLKIAVIHRAQRLRIISMVLLPMMICVCFSWAIAVYEQTPVGCDYVKKYEYFVTKVAAILFTTCRTYVPGIIISTFNCLIVYELYTSRKNLVVNFKAATQRKKEIYRLTIVVLIISITHVILSLPISIFMAIMNARGHTMNNFSEKGNYILGLALEMPTYSNHSINFLLYMLTSPRLRAELCYILGCKQSKLK